MNKLCRLIVTTTCVLAMTTTTAVARLKIKPSLSISLNKRSICGEVENKYYLNSLAGATGYIKKYANTPFGDMDSATYPKTDDYLGPGFTYVQDNTFILKKSGTAEANALTTDAIDGDKLFTILYSTDVTNVGYVDTNGQLFFPIESVSTSNAVSTLTFPDLTQTNDGVTSIIVAPTPSYSYVTSTTNKLLKITDGFSTSGDNAIKKYYSQDSAKKYYIVMGESLDSPAAGAISDNINNFDTLVTYDVSTDANTYTQMDYEHVDYCGVTIGLVADYELSDFLSINLTTDITTPVEKIEHTGKFISIQPEADMAIKAGITLGNSNGNIGFLYGVTYDRYTALLKRFTTPVGGKYLETNQTNIKTFAICQEINANIRLTSQIDAHFSTVLTGSDYKVDLKGSTKRSPVTDQRFAVGFSMNY